MSGFLDYLDEFDVRKMVPKKKIKEDVVEQIQPSKKSKVLCLNVEVRTPDGARLVIEKLQDWISKQEGVVVKKETFAHTIKKPFKIPPKKVIRNPIVEAKLHAINILDGLPDTPEENRIPIMMEQNGINTMIPQPQPFQHNLDSVAGHASALL